MILHQRVDVIQHMGENEQTGDPLPPRTVTGVPADVLPLSTEEKSNLGTSSTSKLRVIFPPAWAALDRDDYPFVYLEDKLKVDGITYEVEGEAELHRIVGRPHHWEFIIGRNLGA